MYDEDQIEDSLEFVRQIKDYYTDENGVIREKKEDLTTRELFEQMASTMQQIGEQKPWEKTLSELAGKSPSVPARSVERQKTEEVDDTAYDLPENTSDTASAAALQQALDELKRLKQEQKQTAERGVSLGEPDEAAVAAEQALAPEEENPSPQMRQVSARDTKKELSRLKAEIAAEKAAATQELLAQEAEGEIQETEKHSLTEAEVDEIFARELKKNKSDDYSEQRSAFERIASQKRKEKRRSKIEEAEVGEKGTIERLKQQKEDFFYRLANRKSVNEMLTTDIEGNKRVAPKRNSLKIVSNVLVVVMCVLIAFSLASLVTNFVAHQTTVQGESMEPTLTNKDSLIIQKVSYYFGDPKRFDIVVFPVAYDTETGSQTYYIKRVIGLPNETVQIIEGKVYINGELLEEDIYGKDDVVLDPQLAAEPLTLGSDEYFVLGDNRNVSTDSRSPYVGMVSKSNIVGKAWFCIWPLNHFGGF